MAGERGEGFAGADADGEVSCEEGVWLYAHADRASVIVDAADYFTHMQAAMEGAKRRIFLIGWDFDSRIRLTAGQGERAGGAVGNRPLTLGQFVRMLVKRTPTLEVRILKWTLTVFQFLKRGSMMWDMILWWQHPRIRFQFDDSHPPGCSHHQKIAVLDNRLAVCGGIDMTDKRWDTRDHLEDQAQRRGINGRPYAPWHDATMMMEGDVAGALASLGQSRWEAAGGARLPRIEPQSESLWPRALPVQFEGVEIGIARTRAHYRDKPEIREIEALFRRHIRGARRFIYAESQYFASRVVAEAILARLDAPDPPEIVIVHPAHADGWLEQQAMDHARALLVRVIEAADRQGRFSIWTPYNGDTAIYVHAKLMVMDDALLRIGSANLNNRSLGLDSECDVFIDSTRPGNHHAAAPIGALRRTLLAEHLGLDDDAIGPLLDQHGSMRSLIESRADHAGRHLRRYRPPELSDNERKLAESEFLDPERPEDMFEPFATGGLFRRGSRLGRTRKRLRKVGKDVE